MKTFPLLCILAFCMLSGCSPEEKTTAKECGELLNSKHATRTDIVAFIERSRHLLRNTPEVDTNIEAERLGLCTGALIRKVGYSELQAP